jgi:peptidoglycan/xylan/chitin deacetylase (PgdA/CDA1 family)
MERREFLLTGSLAALAVGTGSCMAVQKSHILTLSFDDGFKDSFQRIADIHEKHGFAACLNIVASAHLKEWEAPNEYHNPAVGDFSDWNRLKARGHEIMPHSWEHANLTELPFEEATERIDRCLDYFDEHLEGFERARSVYNFAYNASTPELEEYALGQVLAVRTGGWGILGEEKVNPLPDRVGPRRLGCWAYGPDNADARVEEEVNQFLESPGGGRMRNLHGLDEEGWGPVSAGYLDSLLGRLRSMRTLEVKPAGVVLASVRTQQS